MFGPHSGGGGGGGGRGVLYLISEISQWNTYNKKKNTVMKQNKWVNGSLELEHKKTTNVLFCFRFLTALG